MEVTQLKNPPVLLGDKFHALKVVDDEGSNSRSRLRRNSFKSLSPSCGSFLSWKEHRIQKDGCFAGARLERSQIQNPRQVLEVKPKPVG